MTGWTLLSELGVVSCALFVPSLPPRARDSDSGVSRSGFLHRGSVMPVAGGKLWGRQVPTVGIRILF